MFENPGGKIKKMSKFLFWAEIIAFCCMGIGIDVSLEASGGIFISVLVASILIAYPSTLFLCAFGELVEKVTHISEVNDIRLNLEAEKEQKKL